MSVYRADFTLWWLKQTSPVASIKIIEVLFNEFLPYSPILSLYGVCTEHARKYADTRRVVIVMIIITHHAGAGVRLSFVRGLKIWNDKKSLSGNASLLKW